MKVISFAHLVDLYLLGFENWFFKLVLIPNFDVFFKLIYEIFILWIVDDHKPVGLSDEIASNLGQSLVDEQGPFSESHGPCSYHVSLVLLDEDMLLVDGVANHVNTFHGEYNFSEFV